MTSNLTRFYLEPVSNDDPEISQAFEDVETIEANEYEKNLQQKNINYIRVDL
jgi:hypothetical protein